MKLASLHSHLIAFGFLFLPYAAFPDAVLDWNEVALARVIAAKQLPPDGARTMAMVHIGIFDAVNAVENRYTPYCSNSHAPAGTSAEAAIAAAAHTILTKLFSDQSTSLDSIYTASLAKIADGHGKTSGIELGRRIGAECLNMRAGDGTGASNSYRPRTSAGVYVSTALPVSPEWATVTPFFMDNGTQFRPGPPPALASAQWARDYHEIKELGALQSTTRTAEQSDIARFWTITGAPSWNPVVRSLASSNRLSLIDNARLFALVNMAATDAFIAVFDAKYEYNFWRPITAIRNGDIDGNDATVVDAGWLPLIDTPLHPEYPCAHCITAGAVASVLEAQFGSSQVPTIEMVSPQAPGITRRWTRIGDYVTEVNRARIWGGIHYRHSTEVGEAMGRQIGALAVKRLLTPVN